MKYYKRSVVRGMAYEQAYRLMEKGLIASREEWDGFHFKRKGNYYILLKDGEIIKNPEKIYNKESRDWCLVIPTKEAIKIMKNYKILRD